MIRRFVFGPLVVALVMMTSLAPQPRASAQRPTGPRVVVLVVVDQMRADYFQSYAFTEGFKRLADGGAVFTDAHYDYASTKTAEAHALMLSGWSPSGTGIVGDAWYDRRTGTNVAAGVSARHKLLNSSGDGGAPEQLLVHTVGDALKQEHPDAIVLATSLKRYAAVLNGGQHPDGAYWFESTTGHFVTSDYYLQEYPAWVTRLNQADLTAPYFGKTWLTHALGTGQAPTNASRNAIQNTPYANDVLLAFAQGLIEGSGVGKDAQPDLVAISFSALDFVGHQYGPETPEFDDTIKAQDRQIGDLLRTLDSVIGEGNYTVAFTADHGAPLRPEAQIARGVDAGRLSTQAFRSEVEKVVTGKLGIVGPVIAAMSLPEVYLNYGAVAVEGVSRSALDRAVVEAIEVQPGIARAYTVDDVVTAEASSDPFLQAVAEGYYADRSGDIHVLVKPNYIFSATGTTHGTPYDYDNHVPLILFGAGIKPGQYLEKMRLNDLAPTIGKLLGIQYKGDPQSRVLTDALR